MRDICILVIWRRHLPLIDRDKAAENRPKTTRVRQRAHGLLPDHVCPQEKRQQEVGSRAQEAFRKFHLTVKASMWMKPWACFASNNVPFKVWLNLWGLIQSPKRQWEFFHWLEQPLDEDLDPDPESLIHMRKATQKKIKSRNPCWDCTQSFPR